MGNKTRLFGFRSAKSKSKPSDEKLKNQRHQPQQLPKYNVVLINDEQHTYEYVIQLLRAVFAYSEEKGFQLAKCVDETQRAIVFTSHRELAELKREQIISFGSDPRVATCRGSMSAIIEPVS